MSGFLVFISLTVIFIISPIQAYASTVYGVFRVVKGSVHVVDSNGKETPARIGQKVFPQQKIKAGPDSRAKVVMIDNNEINVLPDTTIEISNYEFKPQENKKNVLIKVLYGNVRTKVEQKYDEKDNNKFQIRTPTAVAGVRGTDFITGYNRSSKTSRIITFEGRVEFGLPGPAGKILNPVVVQAGFTTTTESGKSPAPPQEMQKSDLQNLNKESSDSSSEASNSRSSSRSSQDTSESPQQSSSLDSANTTSRETISTEPTKAESPQVAQREPNSQSTALVSGSMMIRPEDLPSTGPVAPPLPSFQAPIIAPVAPILPVAQPIVTDIIQTQNRRLDITIVNGN